MPQSSLVANNVNWRQIERDVKKSKNVMKITDREYNQTGEN